MRIEHQVHGKVCVVTPQGDIRLGEGDVALREAIQKLVEQGNKHLVVDFAKTAFLDSAGLGEVVACRKRVVEAGGEMKLSTLNPRIDNLFTLTKLRLVFEVYDSAEQAIASF